MAGRWRYEVGGETRATGQYEDYPTNPEEKTQPGVPTGKLTQMPSWRSKIFEGTSRDWWVYVPAQAAADKPLSVMVFQDGGGPKNWMPTIFDNMIAKGEIPPTVGIFINPGKFDNDRSNRSVEYDTLSDKYARFLIEEILPEVGKTVTLTQNPDERAIFGVSSGGICAFTVAWEHPEAFRKVASGVGSFVNLQGGATGIGGGHNYPILIRKSVGNDKKLPPKPIRVYLSDGANDLDNPFGNWPLANQYMAKSLAWAGYDHKFVYGNGFHSGRYSQYLMPDTLRWLWRK
jgi:enterochelin esterase family protein